MKKWYWALSVIVVIIVAAFVLLFSLTGFLQAGGVDDFDSNHWNYTDGLIDGADEFEIQGSNETCWILIHSYGATPKEMRVLAERISSEFNDSVFGLRLAGHGEVPSHIQDLSLEDWYAQVEEKYLGLSETCGNVNIGGSSFGGALSARLAEEYELKNVYLIDAYLSPTYRWYYGFSLETYLDWFASSWHYSKRAKLAKINDLDGLANHVAYWRFVFEPVKNSRDFLENVTEYLGLIEEGILIQHSLGDDVAEPDFAQKVFDEVSSENKGIVLFEDSNHIILMDYDSDVAIENIVEFERENR